MEVKKKIYTCILFVAIGVVFGWLYYNLIGCVNGSCPITSSVWRTMAYCGFAGLLTAYVATGE